MHHFAAPGKVTLARLARKGDDYYLTIVPGEIVHFEEEKMRELGATATPAWPIAFTKCSVSADEFIEKYPCNHIHGVYGDLCGRARERGEDSRYPLSDSEVNRDSD